MKKTEKTKSNSYLFWGSIGLAVGCFAYVLSGKVVAIRFSTLEGICKTLDCQPGDILEYIPQES